MPAKPINIEKQMDDLGKFFMDVSKKARLRNEKIATEALSQPECNCRECSKEREAAKKVLNAS